MGLTDVRIRRKPTDKPYKLTDGEGMYLKVHPNGSKYWRLQYQYKLAEKAYNQSPWSALRSSRSASC